MRRACCLLLVLVACQNHTEERLQKAEKAISEIKATQAAETGTAPVPSPTDTANTASLPIEKRVNALQPEVAASFVHQHIAAYIPIGGRSTGALVFQDPSNHQAILYRFDEASNLYRPVQGVDDIQRDASFTPVPDYVSRLQHILDPFPLEATYGRIRDTAARELYVEKGTGAFIATDTDAEAGLIAVVAKDKDAVFFKFDKSIGQYRPVEVIPSLVGTDGHLVLDDARRADLKERLAKY